MSSENEFEFMPGLINRGMDMHTILPKKKLISTLVFLSMCLKFLDPDCYQLVYNGQDRSQDIPLTTMQSPKTTSYESERV